jgi:undecaprenyl-diphosphatase
MSFKKILDLDARYSNNLRLAENPGALRTFAIFLAHSGDSWFWIIAIILVWFTANPYWKSRALILGGSILVTAFLVFVIKFTVRRRRPEGDWGEIYRTADPHSFPSGHAARAFLLAILAIGLGPTWFAIILVIWAPLVGLARVAMGIHYVSDVLAGALIGISMGLVNYNLVPVVINYLTSWF